MNTETMMNDTVGIYDIFLSEDRLPVLRKEGLIMYETKENHTSSGDVAEWVDSAFKMSRRVQEMFVVICYDVRKRIIGAFPLYTGTGRMACVSCREVYMAAISLGADSIIAVHNHPSQDCSPSHEDRIIALKLHDAGVHLDIELTDFLIVGGENGAYYSFRDSGDL